MADMTLGTPTRVEIDPNVRSAEGWVRTPLRYVTGRVTPGQPVRAFESEDGIAYDGVVRGIDSVRAVVFIEIDWSSLKDDDPSTHIEQPPAASSSLGLRHYFRTHAAVLVQDRGSSTGNGSDVRSGQPEPVAPLRVWPGTVDREGELAG